MAEEVSLLSSPSESSTSLLSEISNASTRAFILAFTVGSCGAFAFGCIIGYSAPTQSSIMKDLNLSIADYSLFGSILTVGLILGALICGKLTDLVGRVYTIWITNILFVIGWFAIAFAKAVWLLDLGRLLQGISIGISAYLGPVYITEIAPRKLRGAACSMSQLFTGVGISVVYALGTVVAWRNLAILGSIPSLMILPLLFFIPESPRWLAKVGREKEVEEILSRLRGENSDVSDEAGEILAYTEHVKQQGDDRGFLKLFQRKYAFSLTIGVVLIALPQLGGLSGYSFYTESIFISTDACRHFRYCACGCIRKTFTPTGFSSWNVLGLSCHSHFILLEGMLTITSTLLTHFWLLFQNGFSYCAGEPLLGNRNTYIGSD
ncbi:sugar transporter ERD6-like 15 isoform X7 [Brassica rapa]|uniref:sugar transporter ERD6-like 15 isoform X7 n=1 Tax=Brassica campestris TaxID=3711 RepID=UPI00142DD0DF|nr:sugar transporter ERD6-like 15 isoform X7 [Brassica rapa]